MSPVLSTILAIVLATWIYRECHFSIEMAKRPAKIVISANGNVDIASSGDCTYHSLVVTGGCSGTVRFRPLEDTIMLIDRFGIVPNPPPTDWNVFECDSTVSICDMDKGTWTRPCYNAYGDTVFIVDREEK